MSLAAFAAPLMQSLGGSLAGGASGVAMTPDNFNPVSPINVAPVGVNLGEITKGYEQGGVTNGGSGANLPSRYAQRYTSGNVNIPAESDTNATGNIVFWGGVAAVVGLGAFIFMKKRG